MKNRNRGKKGIQSSTEAGQHFDSLKYNVIKATVQIFLFSCKSKSHHLS